ncbi:MAG: hypothetical protein MI919_35015 [Holophagales bacterium]|nr:hypothetical protein [Holophagales bacterium]
MSARTSGTDASILRFPAVWLVAVIVLVGALPAVAQSGWWQKFRQAREIVDGGGDLDLAERLLREAIAEKGEASGNILRRYTPYFYLGVILAERGDCRQAIATFDQSERFGALKEDQQTDLARRRSRCQKLVDDVRGARAEADRALAQARDRVASVGRLRQRPPLAEIWSSGSPSFAERTRRASDALDQVESRIERADADLDQAALGRAAQAAAAEGTRLSAIEEEAEARLVEIDAALAAAVAAREEQEQESARLLRTAAAIQPYPSRLGRRIASVEQLLERAEAERETAGSEELDALAEELSQENRRLSSQLVGPPRALVRAAGSFLANDFRAALESLGGHSPTNDRQRFFSLLLEGAALHGLIVELGTEAPEEQARLEAVVREAAAFDPAPGAPGETFFPPAFRQLYEAAIEERIAAEAEAALREELEEEAAEGAGEPIGGGSGPAGSRAGDAAVEDGSLGRAAG